MPTMDYRNPEGVIIPSVTTCLRQIEQRELTAWRLFKAMEAYDKGHKKAKAAQAAMDIAKAAEVNAADLGTWLHECAALALQRLPELPILEGAKSECENLLESLDRFITNLKEWTILSIESPIYGCFDYQGHKVEYGGTPDAILRYKGDIILLDFKSSRELYPTMAAQLAGYGQAWNNTPNNPRIDRFWLVHLSKQTAGEWGIKRLSTKELRLGWYAFQSAAVLWYVYSGRWGITLDW